MIIAQAQQLKAKVMLKGKHNHKPHKMVTRKLPDGAGMLSNVPQRKKSQSGDEAADDATYCKAINKVSSVFGKQKRSNSTAAEHNNMYMCMMDGWLVRKGFGSYVEAEIDKFGQLVDVHPQRKATGNSYVVHNSEQGRFGVRRPPSAPPSQLLRFL